MTMSIYYNITLSLISFCARATAYSLQLPKRLPENINFFSDRGIWKILPQVVE
jgi:hypothetical protein